MDPRILGNHRRAAQERIDVAARTLAEKAGVDPALAAALSAYHARDPETNRLRQQEALADLLEALAKEPKRAAPQPDPETGERPGDIGFKRPARATPQDAGAGGGEPPAPAVPPKQHAAVRERAKARGGK